MLFQKQRISAGLKPVTWPRLRSLGTFCRPAAFVFIPSQPPIPVAQAIHSAANAKRLTLQSQVDNLSVICRQVFMEPPSSINRRIGKPYFFKLF